MLRLLPHSERPFGLVLFFLKVNWVSYLSKKQGGLSSPIAAEPSIQGKQQTGTPGIAEETASMYFNLHSSRISDMLYEPPHM